MGTPTVSNRGTRVGQGSRLGTLGLSGSYPFMMPHLTDLFSEHTMLLYIAVVFIDNEG